MRALRPEPEQHVDKHRAVALRAYIKGLELYPHEVEFFLYDEILPGYAWIFPAGDDVANIGLGMRLDRFRKLKKNLKKMLQDFLEMPAIRERMANGTDVRDVAIWQLNFGFPLIWMPALTVAGAVLFYVGHHLRQQAP